MCSESRQVSSREYRIGVKTGVNDPERPARMRLLWRWEAYLCENVPRSTGCHVPGFSQRLQEAKRREQWRSRRQFQSASIVCFGVPVAAGVKTKARRVAVQPMLPVWDGDDTSHTWRSDFPEQEIRLHIYESRIRIVKSRESRIENRKQTLEYTVAAE